MPAPHPIDAFATTLLDVEKISTRKLIRDRRTIAEDPDLANLKLSIQENGLFHPIRVSAEGPPHELIQGWRRLSAFRALLTETRDAAYAQIPAILTRPGESVPALYRRMVDENLARKDVSFAEMGLLALAYADDPETGAEDLDKAVRTLFRSASYQKRSYIRAFAQLMRGLEKHLCFPEAIPRDLGLTLKERMADIPGLPGALARALDDLGPHRSAQEERAVLRRFALTDPEGAPDGPFDGDRIAPARQQAGHRGAETTLRLMRPLGEATCRARRGRLEIRGPEDFAAFPPIALERALAAFYRALD